MASKIKEAAMSTNGWSSANIERRRRHIVMLAVPPIEELDLVGPVQVFASANRLLSPAKPVYGFEIVTNAREQRIRGEAGLSLIANGHYTDVRGKFDSLLVVCGVGPRKTRDAALFSWMRTVVGSVRRIGSVCVGSFLLAEAGLLDGKRATSHWKFATELAKRYPRVAVDPKPIFIKDGNMYTSAGISAGIDLALAWVEEDCGNAIAHEVARELVLFLRRPAGQTQVSISLTAQASEMRSMHELQVWIAENLQTKLSVETLAARMAMSVRNFERSFVRELGRTPSRYVAQMRVEAALRQLEHSDKSLAQIASACGFPGADVMRRAFVRLLGTTPATPIPRAPETLSALICGCVSDVRKPRCAGKLLFCRSAPSLPVAG
jgi:transcriptional regulator GlxA family with amidase domain